MGRDWNIFGENHSGSDRKHVVAVRLRCSTPSGDSYREFAGALFQMIFSKTRIAAVFGFTVNTARIRSQKKEKKTKFSNFDGARLGSILVGIEHF